jgi:hypothetical protein
MKLWIHFDSLLSLSIVFQKLLLVIDFLLLELYHIKKMLEKPLS